MRCSCALPLLSQASSLHSKADELCGLLLYKTDKTGRRGSIAFLHVLPRHRRRGLATRLVQAVQGILVTGTGTVLTFEAAPCQARASAAVMLVCGFMGSEELLTCTLAEDGTGGRGRSTGLTFTWRSHANDQDEAKRRAFLLKVATAQPSLRDICVRAAPPDLPVERCG